LAEEVEAKRFREDLYYRINVLTISMPPLRERGNDVLLLAEKFTGPGWEWRPDARTAVQAYHWPGNVRQLMNAIERAKILADDEVICLKNLPLEVTYSFEGKPPPAEPEVDLAAVNRSHVVQAMQREHGNKVRAAKSLGISRRSLYRLLEKYGIKEDEYVD
jgi:DNA-binding NtrC family response regulator